jgi:hypothetical protein
MRRGGIPMRRLLAVGLIAVAVIWTQATAKADKPGDIAAIDALFTRYNALLWNEGNTDAIGSEIYRAPVLSVRPDSSHVVIPTGEDLSKRWRDFREQTIKNGAQPGSFKIESISVCLIGHDVATVATTYSFQKAGGEIAHSGWFYVVQNADGAWRIVMITPRDVATQLSCQG